MNKDIENYIENTLSKIAILDEPNVSFEQITILEYKTHYENGSIFMHQNGDNYALVILNAITKESYFQIAKTIKKSKNLSIKNIKDMLEEHYLKCYIAGSSKEYYEWQTGDVGTAYLQINEDSKTITPCFINETSKTRV